MAAALGHSQSRLVAAAVGQALHDGVPLDRLQPGQRTFPYHWHVLQEEWLIVVSGEPTLRSPDGEQTLVPGDVAVFPCGPAGGHSIRNDTSEPVRLLMLSSKAVATEVSNL